MFDSRQSLQAGAVALLICSAPAFAQAPPDLRAAITTDRAQTMEGFGGSFAPWIPTANYDIDATARLLVRDLGVTTMRMEMAHYPLHAGYAFDGVRTNAENGEAYRTPVRLSGDLAADVPLFDMQTERVKVFGEFARAMDRQKLDDFNIVSSIWSPPIWMKGQERSAFNGDPVFNDIWGETSPGVWEVVRQEPRMPVLINDNIIGGSLKRDADTLEQFGRYVSTWTAAFEQAYGVPIGAVSLQNEPNLSVGYSHTMYDADTYRDAILAMDRALHATGQGETLIFGPETVGVGPTTAPGIQEYHWRLLKAVLADPEANAALDRFAIHGYDSTGVGASEASSTMWNQYRDGRTDPTFIDEYGGRRVWDELVWDGTAAYNRPAWMTEGSGQLDTWLKSIDPADGQLKKGALDLAIDMHTAIVEGDAASFLYWMLHEDKAAVDQYTLFENGDTSTPKYNAFKHFSRYVRPGAQRLELGSLDEGIAGAEVLDADGAPLTDAQKRIPQRRRRRPDGGVDQQQRRGPRADAGSQRPAAGPRHRRLHRLPVRRDPSLRRAGCRGPRPQRLPPRRAAGLQRDHLRQHHADPGAGNGRSNPAADLRRLRPPPRLPVRRPVRGQYNL